MEKYWVITPYHSNKPDIFDSAWDYDLKNGTIAVGWHQLGNVLKLTNEELKNKFISIYGDDSPKNRNSLWKFCHEINKGDVLIVKRGLYKLIGIGKVLGKAYYDEKKGKERIGHKSENYFPYFIPVKWSKKVINFEKQVFMISALYEIPAEKYKFLIAGGSSYNIERKQQSELCMAPARFAHLINDINRLKKDSDHKERAHESLVESFYELLGYKKIEDIKYRQGRIDIKIVKNNKTVLVNEVKQSWDLNINSQETVRQAYNYAQEVGARYVAITNGDYYGLFDRKKGLSYKSNLIGDFQLSQLRKGDLSLIEKLKKRKIGF